MSEWSEEEKQKLNEAIELGLKDVEEGRIVSSTELKIPLSRRPMRVLVCGGRDYTDRLLLFNTLNDIRENRPIAAIVHGAARGADSIAGEWARANNITEEVYPAQWDLYGKKAGYLRNIQMADTKPDLVVAFPGGRGTQHMITIAYERNIPVQQVKGINT